MTAFLQQSHILIFADGASQMVENDANNIQIARSPEPSENNSLPKLNAESNEPVVTGAISNDSAVVNQKNENDVEQFNSQNVEKVADSSTDTPDKEKTTENSKDSLASVNVETKCNTDHISEDTQEQLTSATEHSPDNSVHNVPGKHVDVTDNGGVQELAENNSNTEPRTSDSLLAEQASPHSNDVAEIPSAEITGTEQTSTDVPDEPMDAQDNQTEINTHSDVTVSDNAPTTGSVNITNTSPSEDNSANAIDDEQSNVKNGKTNETLQDLPVLDDEVVLDSEDKMLSDDEDKMETEPVISEENTNTDVDNQTEQVSQEPTVSPEAAVSSNEIITNEEAAVATEETAVVPDAAEDSVVAEPESEAKADDMTDVSNLLF